MKEQLKNPNPRWWGIIDYPELIAFTDDVNGTQLRTASPWLRELANKSEINDGDVYLKLPRLTPFDINNKCPIPAYMFAYQHLKHGINVFVTEASDSDWENQEPGDKSLFDEVELQYLGVKADRLFESESSGNMRVLFCESVEVTHHSSSLTINIADENFINEKGEIIITRSGGNNAKALNQKFLYVDSKGNYQPDIERMDAEAFKIFYEENNPWAQTETRAEKVLGSILVSGGIKKHFNSIEGETFMVSVNKNGSFYIKKMTEDNKTEVTSTPFLSGLAQKLIPKSL